MEICLLRFTLSAVTSFFSCSHLWLESNFGWEPCCTECLSRREKSTHHETIAWDGASKSFVLRACFIYRIISYERRKRYSLYFLCSRLRDNSRKSGFFSLRNDRKLPSEWRGNNHKSINAQSRGLKEKIHSLLIDCKMNLLKFAPLSVS